MRSQDQERNPVSRSSEWIKYGHGSLGKGLADRKLKNDAVKRTWEGLQDEDRTLNREADKRSVGLLPCSLNHEGYSISIKNAKRQNRGEQKRLSRDLVSLKDNFTRVEEAIVSNQKAIVEELIAEYPNLKHQLCLLFRDAPQPLFRFGLPRIRLRKVEPPSMRFDNSGCVDSETKAKSNGKLALTGLKCWEGDSKQTKTPVVISAKPSNIKPHTNGARTVKHKKKKKKSMKPLPTIGNPTPEITIAPGMTPSIGSTPTTVRGELESPAGFVKDSLTLPSVTSDSQMSPTSGYFKFPDLSNVKLNNRNATQKPSLKTIKVSHYVQSDFGFHPERMNPNVGMSNQKKFSQQKEVVNSIAETAQKHINACQAASLRTRGSRAEQSVEDLKTLLHPGGSWKVQRFTKLSRVGSQSYGGAGLHRAKTFHPQQAKIWTLPNILTKSFDHIGKLVVVEKK